MGNLSDFPLSKSDILKDFETAVISREASLMGRKEVLSGKAKFGIFGDGKEVAQVAMARAFKKGDWRAGYYRDQTFMLATGELTAEQFFAQLYADTDLTREPASGGRQMNSHFATRYFKDGDFTDQLSSHNVAADLSPTAGQMAKLVGLGYASKLYRESEALKKWQGAKKFSDGGNEVAFGTIGNASTSEGLFWESINAAGVLQIPLAMSVWDDGYGISVPNKYQTTKGSISEVLSGFQNSPEAAGYEIYKVKGWDYETLVETYLKGVEKCRKEHNPCLFHITEMTQPQGHSTSGSHERYKSTERLAWETEYDCIARMKTWMIENKVATEAELSEIESRATGLVTQAKNSAWKEAKKIVHETRAELANVLESCVSEATDPELQSLYKSSLASLEKMSEELVRPVHVLARKTLHKARVFGDSSSAKLASFNRSLAKKGHDMYRTHLFIEGEGSALQVGSRAPEYSENSPKVDGRQIIQKYFDQLLEKDPRVFIIGEDVGQLGGVNLEFEGLSETHGLSRISDTGIREATILGQGQGASMRGLRPVIDIQYLDYLLYCLQGISDDVSTLHYRTCGGQINPAIIRTKGHRLEGIWHTGSPIGMILNSVRGVHLCVPRNMTQAAGMYQTLMKGLDPAIVIEVLNGYRVKETLPDNVGEYSVELGKVETLKSGNDITVVTYGACCRVALDAAKACEELAISLEVIDAQTLLPFDRSHDIVNSLQKTNALIVMDEDVPEGASAYILTKILEDQNGYDYLDAKPVTVCAAPNRSAYASDADYYCKPSAEDLVEAAIELMHERKPHEHAPLLD